MSSKSTKKAKKTTKKGSIFNKLCTMGKGKTTSSKKKEKRKGMTNETVSPYAEIPFFDDTTVEDYSMAQSAMKTSTKASTAKSAGTRGGTTQNKRSTTGRTNNRTPKNNPTDMAYQLQPWLVFVLSTILCVGMILSGVMSDGRYDLTPNSHPFRLIGYGVEYFLFGLIGYGAFLLPLGLLYLSIFQIRVRGSEPLGSRGLLLIAMLILFPAMIHAGMLDAGSVGGALDTLSIGKLYHLGAQKSGGGVLGGFLGWILYRCLGVIGTMLIGSLAMVLFLMLFFGTTPAAVARSIRKWYAERAARFAELQEREKEARYRAQEPEVEEDSLALTSCTPKKAQLKEEKKRRDDAMREAERSDRIEKKLRDREKKTEEDYIDPVQLLLEGDEKKATGKSGKKKDTTPAVPTETAEPLETVTELTEWEVNEREKYYKDVGPMATPMSDTDRDADPLETEPLREYPQRVELAIDDTDGAPEIHVTGDAAEDIAEADADGMEIMEDIPDTLEAVDFDYGMTSEDDVAQEEAGEEKEDVLAMNGVDVHIKRLNADDSKKSGDAGERQSAQDDKIAKQAVAEEVVPQEYKFPKIEFLTEAAPRSFSEEKSVREKAERLWRTFADFKVKVEDINCVCGPTVTRFEIKPAPGVHVRTIANLADDISLSLATAGVRMEIPIPGKASIGIEIPNDVAQMVSLRGLIDSEEFRGRKSKLTACLGEDVSGNPIMFDVVKMPHLLIGGTTGSGKSVCINSIIMSFLYKAKPDEVRMILIDPKTVEFSVYRNIPHLMAPIVCDAKRAAAALNLAVLEMERRFEKIREVNVREISAYNKVTENDRYEHPYMPQIVIVIDELADLMMQARDEVETSICRLAQKGRAAGMHLIIGTQRPSTDVVTGLIKTNVPSRIAFAVKQQVDSRVMLDTSGAEKLIGHGDMLYAPIGCPKPLRVQGAFVSDEEVEKVVDYIRRNNEPVKYDQEFLDNLDREAEMIGKPHGAQAESDDEEDENTDGVDSKFYEALKVALDNNRISVSLIQRALSIGYQRAARIVDQMEAKGFVSHAVGNKPREILITHEDYEELMGRK